MAVRDGNPPISADTPMAIATVTDFGAMDATTVGPAPNAQAMPMAARAPVAEPSASEERSAGRERFTCSN